MKPSQNVGVAPVTTENERRGLQRALLPPSVRDGRNSENIGPDILLRYKAAMTEFADHSAFLTGR
jgi:hypothetical protein